MRWSKSARIATLAIASIALSGCKSDGDGFFASVVTQRPASDVGSAATAISGSPKTSVRVGEQYEFEPQASSTIASTLRFGIRNQPNWATFDANTGELSGRPDKQHVGVYPDVTISVTSGSTTSSLTPFDIRVVEATATSGAWTPSTQPVSAAGATFEFAEIPEIVFVRGYRESEHMGIFQLDTRNRWSPGDLDNVKGWTPRIGTELVTVTGNVTGVRYDPATGILSYDGSGSGTETATVYLQAPSENVRSAEFNIRVLAPTIAWGTDAARKFPGIGYDSSATPWTDMQRLMRARAPYEDPNVLLVTPGTYADDFFIAADRLNVYILGEPTGRPVFRGDGFSFTRFETTYLKNLELWDTTVGGTGYLTDRKVNFYVTKVYQHDGTREQNGFSSPAYEGDSRYGIVLPPGEWRHWIWNFHGSQMGGTGNTTHQFYLEGRPNTYAIFNNIRITGSRASSSIKSTRYHNIIRNSYISALLDPENPQLGLRSDKLVDVVSAGESVLYNNDFVGANTKAHGGIGGAMVHFRARRSWWASDSPAYPDVSYSPATTSLSGGGYLAPLGFSAGPETFVNPAFWDTVSSYDLEDPNNPYTFKKYLSYNTFRWIDEGEAPSSPIRDDGTAPRQAVSQFSNAEYWGTVPRNWVERSVSFTANNSYAGWDATDVPDRFIDMTWTTSEGLVTRVGPGPWAWPAPARTLVVVGGEHGPLGQNSPVDLPTWFRK